ncbi:hypothetical protein WN55_06986 [Dufourea novaeangliae]|uniref:Uncharacterized protein n=1 Tax=Dufourea novaeangliae TaxID=178035 RepID=A0A154P0Z3_DUFNO|nr:hypothetical protein WN55_06986 [Dufourea novaeangliae]
MTSAPDQNNTAIEARGPIITLTLLAVIGHNLGFLGQLLTTCLSPANNIIISASTANFQESQDTLRKGRKMTLCLFLPARQISTHPLQQLQPITLKHTLSDTHCIPYKKT